MKDLQADLESLRQENARLRKLLKMTDTEASPAHGTQAAWFDKAPGSVDARSSSQANLKAARAVGAPAALEVSRSGIGDLADKLGPASLDSPSSQESSVDGHVSAGTGSVPSSCWNSSRDRKDV